MTLLRKLFISIISITLLISCSKKEDSALNTDSDYFMSFKANGTEIIYKDILTAQYTDLPNQNLYGLTIAGANFDGPNTDEDFGIILMDDAPITEGSYNQDYIPNTYSSRAFISYIKGVQAYSSVYPLLSDVAKANVTITEITNTYISGTFSGTLVKSDGDYSVITHEITNGKFKIKLQ
ncbi:MAG: hypothetical protein KDC67_16480 [Ignavibacteriae bacterium]|nr:hypothetical protein [Ignavibacteriota bacterium]